MIWVSASCKGERCRMCQAPAAAKIGEEIAYDDPFCSRHNLTAYVCREHFIALMGLTGVTAIEAMRQRAIGHRTAAAADTTKCRASWSDGECMLAEADCPNPVHGDPSHCPRMKVETEQRERDEIQTVQAQMDHWSGLTDAERDAEIKRAGGEG